MTLSDEQKIERVAERICAQDGKPISWEHGKELARAAIAEMQAIEAEESGIKGKKA